MSHCAWLEATCHPKEMLYTVGKLSKLLKKHKIQAIAVRGVSGIAIGAAVAFELELPLIIIRKGSESRHSSNVIEFSDLLKKETRIGIIDDFISSGETMTKIINMLHDFNFKNIVGIFVYDGLSRRKTYKRIKIYCINK